jgi:hypothetical protein
MVKPRNEKLRIEVVDPKVAAILAAKTPAERIALANQAHRFACQMIKARVEQLYPEWSTEQKHHEFLRRLLGDGAKRYLEAHG